jgi:dTDP-4-dehydrorhamnose reductase
MKILLLGKNGQVGWELQRALSVLGEVTALDRHSGTEPQGHCGDLNDLAGLARTVQALRPDVIVNAAAHTAVDKAESEPHLARRLNAQAPTVLAQEAAQLGALLVHYSTDYVFNGSGDTPWLETDATSPLSVYGQTKREGEQGIAASGAPHLIFRTSWVYAARGGNFAKTMLRLASEREALSVISDQIGAPTGAELLADATAQAIRVFKGRGPDSSGDLSGLYHLSASGSTSWHGYAQFVIERARAKQAQGSTPNQVGQAGQTIKVAPDAVQAIPTSAYPTPAQRPLNSRLNTQKFQTTFGLTLPHWQQGVARMLDEIL